MSRSFKTLRPDKTCQNSVYRATTTLTSAYTSPADNHSLLEPQHSLLARPARRNSPPRRPIPAATALGARSPSPPRQRPAAAAAARGRAGPVAAPSPPRRSLPSHRSQPWRRRGGPGGGVGRARAARRPRMAADGGGRDGTHSLSAMISAGREGRTPARRALSSFARAGEALPASRTPGLDVHRCA